MGSGQDTDDIEMNHVLLPARIELISAVARRGRARSWKFSCAPALLVPGVGEGVSFQWQGTEQSGAAGFPAVEL